jgi:predicted metalloprotease with PDZ domain
LVLQRLGRDGPAQRAGLVVGDEWIALDGLRLRSIDDLMVHLQPEAPLIPHQLLFCRDGLVRSTVLLPTAPAVESWQLQLDPATTDPGCAERRRRWLGLEAA